MIALYRQAYAGLSPAVWLLSAITLVHRSGTMVLPFLALYLTQKLGYSAEQAGVVLAFYGVGAVGGAQLGGWLSDRLGPLTALTLSFFTSGIALIALGYVTARGWLELTVMLSSLTSESHRPANASAVAAFTKAENRFRAFALRRLAVNIGMTFGPAVGGLLAMFDYFWLFLCNGGACLAAGLLMVWVLRAGHLRLEPPKATESDADTKPRQSPWRDGLYLGLMFWVTVVSFLFLQLLSTYPLTLREQLGYTEPVIGLLFAVNTAVIVLLEMVLIDRVGRFSPLRVVAVGMIAMALGFGLLPWATSTALLIGTVLLWTLGEMLSLPLFEGVAASLAPESARGAYLGIYTATFSVALVAAPLIGAWVYQNLGWQTLWIGCGALFLVLAVVFWLLAGRVGERLDAVRD